MSDNKSDELNYDFRPGTPVYDESLYSLFQSHNITAHNFGSLVKYGFGRNKKSFIHAVASWTDIPMIICKMQNMFTGGCVFVVGQQNTCVVWSEHYSYEIRRIVNMKAFL